MSQNHSSVKCMTSQRSLIPWLQLPRDGSAPSLYQAWCGEDSFTPWHLPQKTFVVTRGQTWKTYRGLLGGGLDSSHITQASKDFPWLHILSVIVQLSGDKALDVW